MPTALQLPPPLLLHLAAVRSAQLASYGPAVTKVGWTAEGGSNGTGITTGNSGGASGDAFDSVSLGSGATAVYDNTHVRGTLSAKLATGGSAADCSLDYGTKMGAQTRAWFRAYCYIPSNPASNHRLIDSWDTGSGQLCWALYLTTTGKLQTVNTSGGQIQVMTSSVPLNAWFRVEAMVIGSATVGQVEVRRFDTPDSLSYDEIITSTAAQNTRGSFNQYRFGSSGDPMQSGRTIWLDDFGISTAGYLGPTGAGTTAQTADAALAVTATFGADASAARPADAALTATATLTAAAVHTAPADAALAITATLAAAATRTALVDAALPVTATLAAADLYTGSVGASLPVTATLSAAAISTLLLAASLPVTATLAAAATRTAIVAAVLPVTAALTAGLALTAAAAASLSVTATLAAAATVGPAPVIADLSVAATLAAAQSRTALPTAALSVTATISATAALSLRPTAPLSVTVTLAAGAFRLQQAAAALAVLASFIAAAESAGSVTFRPFTGTTIRPSSGTTVRPTGGTTTRPGSGITIRPFTGTTIRP